MALISQAAARYRPDGGREHCSLCRHFIALRGGSCRRVLGRISPRGWCKLFSQEVHARIPDVTTFSGGGGGPALGLDFMVPGVLDPRITFTRASTATYFDSAGVMQTAAVNAPRWDYDPVTLALRGLLLEDQRTNRVLNSADASNASWGKVGLGTPAPTVTGNQATAPDGTLTAARVVYPAVSVAGNYSHLGVNNGPATAAPYTFTVWAKGSVGGEQIYMQVSDGTTYYRNRITLTTTWDRYTLITSNLTTLGWFFQFGNDRRDAGTTATLAQTIFVWGAQVELGDFATSYIPTSTVAVTRSIDSCLIPPANMTPWFVAPGGSWFAEFDYFDVTPSNSRVIGRPDTAGGVSPLLLNATRNIGQNDGVTLVTANATTAGAITKACSTWAVGSARICANGGAVASSASLATGYGAFTAAGIRLLSVGAALGTDNTSGHIRAMRYWPTVLTDAQMQAMTAP